MQLCLSTYPEVEKYLEDSDGIIVPVGSTEQHSPMGLIGTDWICAESIGRRAGQLAGAMVGPTLNVGMSIHHMRFAGSMTLRPTTMINVISDWVNSLAAHGFGRIMLVNGHGGNIGTIKAAFGQIHAERFTAGRDELLLKLANWWDSKVLTDLVDEIHGDKEGHHATPAEIAVTQAVYPDRIKTAELGPFPSADLDIGGPDDFRRRYPDGRIGSDPSLATPENGRLILQTAAAEVAKVYREFMAAD